MMFVFLCILYCGTFVVLWAHLKINYSLIQFCTPLTDDMWLRIASFPMRFVPETLMFSVFVAWLVYVYIVVCDPEPDTSGQKREAHNTVVPQWLVPLLLTFFTGISTRNFLDHILISTWKIGVVRQDPILSRVVDCGMAHPEEIGLTSICLLCWLFYGVFHTIQQIRVRLFT